MNSNRKTTDSNPNPNPNPNPIQNRRSLFRPAPPTPTPRNIQELPDVVYVTSPLQEEEVPPPLPPKLKRRQTIASLPPTHDPPPLPPKLKSPKQTMEPQFVYINSSNGYIDKEVSQLKIRVNQLEEELRRIKILLEKQNK